MKCSPEMVQAPCTSEKRPRRCDYLLNALDRTRLVLGTMEDGYPLALAMRGRNIVIAGDPRSGKSWVAGLMCEQLILQGYNMCIIDAEGDYRTLESLPGVVVFGGDNPVPELPDLSD